MIRRGRVRSRTVWHGSPYRPPGRLREKEAFTLHFFSGFGFQPPSFLVLFLPPQSVVTSASSLVALTGTQTSVGRNRDANASHPRARKEIFPVPDSVPSRRPSSGNAGWEGVTHVTDVTHVTVTPPAHEKKTFPCLPVFRACRSPPNPPRSIRCYGVTPPRADEKRTFPCPALNTQPPTLNPLNQPSTDLLCSIWNRPPLQITHRGKQDSLQITPDHSRSNAPKSGANQSNLHQSGVNQSEILLPPPSPDEVP